MNEDTLISLVHAYKQTNAENDKKKAIDALGEFLYTQLHRFRLDRLTEDTRSDFIVSLYPRFEKLIEQFDASRSAFGTYIRWIVRLSYRTFVKNRCMSDARQRVYETEETTRLMSLDGGIPELPDWCANTCEREQPYSRLEKPRTKTRITNGLSDKKKEIRARQIFLLACKSGFFLDESADEQLSTLTGYDIEYIRSKLEYIRTAHRQKTDRLRSDQERKNGYYLRCQRSLYEMKYLDRDTARYRSLEKEYQYCLKRWNDLKNKASRQIRTPSNRFLARTLGISRGTIDATLASALNEGYGDVS